MLNLEVQMAEEETETEAGQPSETNIGSSNTKKVGEEFQKLVSLAQKLRLCRSPQNQCNPTETRNGVQEIITKNSPEGLDSAAQRKAPGRAAVLVCIFEGNEGELRVFLTKRSSSLSSHSGEVALPGGKRDKADANDIETALREAQEEIGLDPSLVDVVTVLQPFFTKRDIIVVPVVGILYNKEAFSPVLNAAEVESIFDVPLEMFLKDENRRVEERQWMGESYLLQYFNYQSGGRDYVIWALTAGILILAASVVYERSPEFVERRPTFWNRSVLI